MRSWLVEWSADEGATWTTFASGKSIGARLPMLFSYPCEECFAAFVFESDEHARHTHTVGELKSPPVPNPTMPPVCALPSPILSPYPAQAQPPRFECTSMQLYCCCYSDKKTQVTQTRLSLITHLPFMCLFAQSRALFNRDPCLDYETRN